MLKCFSGWTPSSPGDSTCPEGSREFCRPSSPGEKGAAQLGGSHLLLFLKGLQAPIYPFEVSGPLLPPNSAHFPPPRKSLCLCSLLTRSRQEPQAVWRCEISCHKGALLARGVVGPGWGRAGKALRSALAAVPGFPREGLVGVGGGAFWCLLCFFLLKEPGPSAVNLIAPTSASCLP